MNQQLIYEIAGHRFSIDTPDAQTTEKLIPTFSPFRVEDDGKSGMLFQFSGNAQISIPNRAPDDVMELVPVYRLDNRHDSEAVALTQTLMT